MLTIIKDKEPSLEKLQKLVGGYIEMHNIGNTHLIVNEEARIIGLPIIFHNNMLKILEILLSFFLYKFNF